MRNDNLNTKTMTDFMTGYQPEEVYEVKPFGNTLKLVDVEGVKHGSLGSSTFVRQSAFKEGMAIQAFVNKKGKKSYRKVPMEVFNALKTPVAPTTTADATVQDEAPATHDEIKEFIHNQSVKLKPSQLMMSELKWKHLVRSAIRARNIMMTGPAGCGKTMAAKALTKALDRPDFYFNLGATQDPRATLIGNTQFSKDKGTYFAKSAFITAITTPNSVILLDEISRAHPDAWNILMTVLDQGQRYVRLDEAEGSPIVKVAEGVTFIATANIGNEYTSTRVIDRAIRDRFTEIEMEVLDADKEKELLTMMFPDVSGKTLSAIAEIASHTREQSMLEDGKLTNMISTRASVEMASLIYDGFDLMEAAEISVFPQFSTDGGTDSERTYIKQYIQKFQDDDGEELVKPNDDFDVDDIPSF